MAEGRVVDYELPEPIIQHIQSFLTGKEAARTITLSKSWHKAWLTRPDLDFDESDFPKKSYYEVNTEFLALAKNTIQRYEDSNQKVESFRLFLQYDNSENRELAKILIVKALKLCASHLSFKLNGCHLGGGFVAPREVFESENLVGLSLKGCVIDFGMDFNVTCHKLESLCLSSVKLLENSHAAHHHVFPKIISSCPLIQNLSLSHLHVTVLSNLPKMHNLKSLTLNSVTLDSLFLDDLSSYFPSLKYLTLDDLYRRINDDELEEEEIQISSRSLERLNLTSMYWTLKFKLDVPSIKKLVIEPRFYIPSVSFKSTSKEWEGSHVTFSLTKKHSLSNAWFLDLSKLLTALSPSSNIYLSINGGCHRCFFYELSDFGGLCKQRVENLNLDIQYLHSLNCYALFDGLFRCCTPKFITLHYQDLDPRSEEAPGANINDFLSKRLVQGTKGVFSSPENFLFGLHELKEVYVQKFYDDDVVVVEDLPWKPLIEASSEIRLEPKQKIRYQLVWKSEHPIGQRGFFRNSYRFKLPTCMVILAYVVGLHFVCLFTFALFYFFCSRASV